nr:FUSC family protein [uncultured Rhodopila sp.]
MTLAPVRIVLDATSALRLDLAEMRLASGRGPGCTMTALAVTLAVMITLLLRLDDGWWAAISAFVSTRATAPASIERGVLRILGTIGGATVALLLSPWLADDTVTLTLVLFAVSTIGVLGLLVSPHGYAWLLSAVTMDMVLLALLSDPLSAMAVAAYRTAEVIIGTTAAIVVVVLLAPGADAGPPAPAPGWSDLVGAQWPAVRHALRAGIGVMLVPVVWNWLELPSLSQTAVTVAAVMAVPALSGDSARDQQTVTERALHRLLGCLLGGLLGLGCLALSVDSLLPWLLMLTAGIWVAAYVQGSTRGIGYVGTQGAVVFICTLVQGAGPPQSLLPGIDRFAGISGGLLILAAVSALTAPSTLPLKRKPA